MNEEQYAIWDEFLNLWPLEKIKTMTLEEYTKVGSKDTFTYWIESKLDKMGSIWGGSSFKFGVYSRKDNKEIRDGGMRSYDVQYGWYTYRGSSAQEAFENIRKDIVTVIEAVQNNDLKIIDGNDLGEAYKWKIAFHYQDRNKPIVLNIFIKSALLVYLGEDKRSVPMSNLYQRVMAKRGSTDLLEFEEDVWHKWEAIKPVRFWKISHGSDAESGENRELLLKENLIAVHKNTSKSQGTKYVKDMQVGDYFYLSFSANIQLIGRVTSDVEDCDLLSDGWLCREYTVVKNVVNEKKYVGPQKGWSPNYNSTCKLVPGIELKLFENNILLPFFNMQLSDFLGEVKIEEEVEVSDKVEPKIINLPLNQILYGPPGTGKTFQLTEYKKLFTETLHAVDDQSWMDSTIGQLSWWEIIVAVVLDLDKPSLVAEIFEHPYTISKCRVTNKTKNVKQQIWAALQTHTTLESTTVNYTSRSEPFVFDKIDGSKWILVDHSENDYPDIIDVMRQYKEKKPNQLPIERFQFVTFHQSFSYEEFVEGIRAVVDEGSENSQINYEVKPGVFLDMCARARSDRDNNYALFIDEINRGNISKIFGELITLIEDDKRDSGEENDSSISVILPYSKEPFSVPSNLYIIGTMNTADRSIKQMDTALRRRFEFKEIMPKPKLLHDKVDMTSDGIDVARILYTINKRIEFLYDREHTIGHAFFWPLIDRPTVHTLKDIFEFKIIPLLQEYFFDDYEKIRIVLGDSQKDTEYQFISKSKIAMDAWFGTTQMGYTEPIEYSINTKAFTKVDSYTGIYDSAPDVDWE